MKYSRILLKLSGESLMGSQAYGIDNRALELYAGEIKSVLEIGCQIGVVIGGGNIFRGVQGMASGVNRQKGDYMGMLATLINGLALQSKLQELGAGAELLSGIAMEPLATKASGPRAIEMLEAGKVVILSGGTGNPYFTTDTAAALRALEIQAEILIKGTRVDGVYSGDPEKDPTATKYTRISFAEVLEQKLRIMDLTAFTLCEENKLPIMVYDAGKAGNLRRLLHGEMIGTLVD